MILVWRDKAALLVRPGLIRPGLCSPKAPREIRIYKYMDTRLYIYVYIYIYISNDSSNSNNDNNSNTLLQHIISVICTFLFFNVYFLFKQLIITARTSRPAPRGEQTNTNNKHYYYYYYYYYYY